MMSEAGLTSGTEFLRKAAADYFGEVFQSPLLHMSDPLDKDLAWVPTFFFNVNNHHKIAVEVSEKAYPVILEMRRIDFQKLQFPVTVYSVCPEEIYVAQQSEVKRLLGDGYGLVTIGSDGKAQKRGGAIPILQQIQKEEFVATVKGQPQKLRQRFASAFEAYNSNAPLGVGDVTEVMEGLVLNAGKAAVRKGWLNAADVKAGKSAATLEKMQSCPQFGNCKAAIGGAQNYISVWRNTSHHFPKNAKKAAQKYRDCRHGFLEGIRQISGFRESMKKDAGLNVSI